MLTITFIISTTAEADKMHRMQVSQLNAADWHLSCMRNTVYRVTPHGGLCFSTACDSQSSGRHAVFSTEVPGFKFSRDGNLYRDFSATYAHKIAHFIPSVGFKAAAQPCNQSMKYVRMTTKAQSWAYLEEISGTNPQIRSYYKSLKCIKRPKSVETTPEIQNP